MLTKTAERHWEHGYFAPLASQALQISRFSHLILDEDSDNFLCDSCAELTRERNCE